MEEVKCYYEGPVSLTQAEQYIEDSLVTTAREYVAIGYWLRRIRDDKLFLEEGYKNFEEYVRQKYRKDGGWASKCIKVNGQFSVDGNSPYLSEQYQGYSKYQLVELAYMTEEQRELVNTDTSIRDMKQLRKPEPEPENQAADPKNASQSELVTSQVGQVTASQEAEPESEILHFIAGDRTIDSAYGATIAAVVRAYLDSGYSRPEKECEVTAFGLVYKVLKRQDVTVFYTDTGRTVFDVENARLEEEYQYWHGTKAKPEPAKPTPPEPEQDSCPPDMSSCRRQEWGTGPAEQEAGKKECKACWASWKRQHKALGAAAVEQEPAEVLQEKNAETQQEPNEVSMSSLEECVLDFQQNHMCKQCLLAVDDRNAKALKQELISNHGKRHNSGSTSYGFYQCDPDRIYFQDDMCETFLSLTWNGYVKELFKLLENSKCREIEDAAQESGTTVSESNPPEDVIDGEFTEIQEPDASDQEAPMTELQIAQEELERAKRLLEKGLGCGVDENDIHIRRLKTVVCAWASYVCDLDSIVNPPPKPVQPELPPLKNNDQRKAWLRDYKSWGLWYRDENIGVSYYKYDFDNGARLIVEEYQRFSDLIGEYTSFYPHLVGGPKPPKHPSYGYDKWTHNEEYDRFVNGDSELYEFLKELQKKG